MQATANSPQAAPLLAELVCCSEPNIPRLVKNFGSFCPSHLGATTSLGDLPEWARCCFSAREALAKWWKIMKHANTTPKSSTHAKSYKIHRNPAESQSMVPLETPFFLSVLVTFQCSNMAAIVSQGGAILWRSRTLHFRSDPCNCKIPWFNHVFPWGFNNACHYVSDCFTLFHFFPLFLLSSPLELTNGGDMRRVTTCSRHFIMFHLQ